MSVSSTPKHFQTAYEGEILCFVTFGPKSSKLNSRPVYCLRLYGRLKFIYFVAFSEYMNFRQLGPFSEFIFDNILNSLLNEQAILNKEGGKKFHLARLYILINQ